MIKIMFICHGNICRSPMAEFIFRDLIKKQGIERYFTVHSCATSTEEIGNTVYSPAKAELASHGISCKGKYAVQLKKCDYEKYDMFICMDSRNIKNTLKIFGNDPENKVHKLLDRDVSDPWYTDRFDVAYNDIFEGCKLLIKSLEKNRLNG